jgi:hypothetical protein
MIRCFGWREISMTPADERLTLGEEIIAWIEATCRVPEGALIGHPIELMDWQKSWILRVYNNPAGTRRAIIAPQKVGQDLPISDSVVSALSRPGCRPKFPAL